MVHNLLQERCLIVTVVGISDLLGSENRSRFLRAASPMIALQLPWIRTARYLAHIYSAGTGGTEESARARFAPLLGIKVALDEWMMALGSFSEIPAPADVARIHKEVLVAADLFEDQGWVHEPSSYHETPPSLAKPQIHSARVALTRYEHLRFESGYEPHAGEPGRERWLANLPNRTAHAWVLRHARGNRPWLICVHGWRMGVPALDLAAFRAKWLHRQLGFNVVLPVLPLHGLRAIGSSGGGFLAADALNTVHAMAQAIWDLRRILSWIRLQDCPRVGAYGLSLGGYTVALLATLEERLDCVIAGIAPSDFVDLARAHSHPLIAALARYGAPPEQDARSVFRVVSPLAAPPRVPWPNRYIFGGLADRMVPRRQVRALWEHWQRPTIAWYNGSHLSFGSEGEVRVLLRKAFVQLRQSADSEVSASKRWSAVA
jgi:dienelactone hydrolase